MIKVSVIIPVYNVEQYLEECLNSVINQTLKDIEIICIDDCSTDNSYQILEEYAKKDSRIIVLKNEKNSGTGTSRNKAIKMTKGEYIGFIDSDDYISEDYFESLYNTAKKFNSDITNNINIYLDTNSKISYYHTNLNRTSNLDIEYESETKINNINILSKNIITTVVWNKIFKKEFLIKNELLFIENKIGSAEDADFIIRTIINDPKMSYNNFGKYYYRIRSDSAMNITGNNDKYLISAIEHVQNTILYCKQKKIEYLDYVYIKTWNSVYIRFNISNELIRKNCYKYVYEFVSSISIRKDLVIPNSEEYKLYEEYLLITNNDIYEKYSLQKELFNRIGSFNYKLNELDKKINNLNNLLNESDKKIDNINNRINELNNTLIKKLDKKIKIFGIDRFDDKKIIYIFGIKITVKNKK